MAQQQQRQRQQQQQPGWWWQQDDIYGVTPQHTGRSNASRSMHSREDQVEEKAPPLPPRRSTSSFQQPWQQDDIYGVTPQHTGGTLLSQRTQPSPVGTRDGGSERRERGPPVPAKIPLAPEKRPPAPEKRPPPAPEKRPPPVPQKGPPLPPRKSTSSLHQHQQHQHQHQQNHYYQQPWTVPDRAPPPPPTPLPPPPHPQTSATHQRSKEHVVAYMIPLPQPVGPHGLPLAVPQRYMLYLPPAPDLLKPDPTSSSPTADGDGGGGGAKERKRDKAHRRWQEEVRKAKTYSGAVVSMRGLYSASVRGAVYVLSRLQRSELTFLSRLPRRTLRELELMHPSSGAGGGGGGGGGEEEDEERFAEVRAEFERNRRVARRDFWIAAALLPFATAIDLVIPVFGGLSEVDMVWMVVTGRAWMAARGVAKRLVLAPGTAARALSDGSSSVGGCVSGGSSGHDRDGTSPYQCAGALGGHDSDDEEDDSDDDDDDDEDDEKHRHPRLGNFTEHLDEEEHPLVVKGEKQDGADPNSSGDGAGRRRSMAHKFKQKRDKEPPVEMLFRPSTSMTLLTHYVQAACHARNARLFPDVGPPQAEVEVLRSIGWAPEEGRIKRQRRQQQQQQHAHASAGAAEGEEEAAATAAAALAAEEHDDVAWQVRKTCEDLRGAVAKAAKTWDKQCRRFASADPERVMGVAPAQGRKELFE